MNHHTLILLRHGIAEERRPDLPDADRALTARGLERTRAVLERLVAQGLAADRLLSSPWRRARQTAEIAVAAGLAPSLEIAEPLVPGGDPLAWLPAWFQPEGAPAGQPLRLLLVGHEPDLSQLAARLLAAPAGSLVLRKAGLAQLALPLQDPRGGGALELLLRPALVLP